ncbi:hypothetical protein E3N88_14343 [Mikania micrantha]|uniref:Uncharacterized protein n=1 Tax=Mikania micrantha TaxID=192012 RepID=A0A5N6P360_9ASTR|nr:hypothetical protein E3N88_14343 [Mikania micrantha]
MPLSASAEPARGRLNSKPNSCYSSSTQFSKPSSENPPEIDTRSTQINIDRRTFDHIPDRWTQKSKELRALTGEKSMEDEIVHGLPTAGDDINGGGCILRRSVARWFGGSERW